MTLQALLFDCDGVLVDTERDGHRVAFNRAFAEQGLDVEWSVERYGELLATAGGKERMRRHFAEHGWPVSEDRRDLLIRDLHARKTAIFTELIEQGELTLRHGVERVVDEGIAAGTTMAVCSTSNEKAVQAVVDVLLGPERARHLPVFAGDVVPAKKPDPAIYRLAADEVGIEPARTVVVEDSRNGLLAAKGAGMRCLVTTSSYTADEDFAEADRVVAELGDPPGVTLADLEAMVVEETGGKA